MKKIFAVMAGALALATFGLSASAADLAKPVYKAPPAPVYAPPVVNTDGFFVGADVGVFVGGFSVDNTKYDFTSYMVGGQLGYQWSGWRFFLDGAYIGGDDFGFASVGGGDIVSCGGGGCPGGSTVVGSFTNYQSAEAAGWYVGLGVSTPGYAVIPNVVLRATGGIGYGEFAVDISRYTNLTLDPPISYSFNTPVTKGSVTAGGFAWKVGAEAELFKYFTLKGGYMGFEGSGDTDVFGGKTKVSLDGGWYATAGLNYKF